MTGFVRGGMLENKHTFNYHICKDTLPQPYEECDDPNCLTYRFLDKDHQVVKNGSIFECSCGKQYKLIRKYGCAEWHEIFFKRKPKIAK